MAQTWLRRLLINTKGFIVSKTDLFITRLVKTKVTNICESENLCFFKKKLRDTPIFLLISRKSLLILWEKSPGQPLIFHEKIRISKIRIWQPYFFIKLMKKNGSKFKENSIHAFCSPSFPNCSVKIFQQIAA